MKPFNAVIVLHMTQPIFVQVLKLRRNANQTLRELEGLAIKYLKQVPFLKEYAKRPTVTYIIYAVLAAPLITILVPLSTLKGEALLCLAVMLVDALLFQRHFRVNIDN